MNTYKEGNEFVGTTLIPTTKYRVNKEQLLEALTRLSQQNVDEPGCATEISAVRKEISLNGWATFCLAPAVAVEVIQGAETSTPGREVCQFEYKDPNKNKTMFFFFLLLYDRGQVRAELLKPNDREMVLGNTGEIHIVNNVPVSGGGWGSRSK